MHQKVILLLFLQKPFLGGIAAYQINASLHQKVNGDQEVNGHLKVISPHQPGQSLEVDLRGQNYHTAVVYEFVLCSAVVVALTLLVLWHVRMISFGETNIEVYINRKEVVRLKKLGLVSHNQEVLESRVISLGNIRIKLPLLSPQSLMHYHIIFKFLQNKKLTLEREKNLCFSAHII